MSAIRSWADPKKGVMNGVDQPVRGKWVYIDGKPVPIGQYRKPEAPAAPAIQTDEIPPTESMATADREFFTSKAKLRQHYKQHGFVETGGDHLTGKPPAPYKSDPKEIRDQVANTLNKLRWNEIPLSEREREQCRREQREYENYKRRNR